MRSSTMLQAFGAACVAAVATAAPEHRSLFGNLFHHHHSSSGVMVYHLNDDGQCGDTKMTSGYMSTSERKETYLEKAVEYMNSRYHISLHAGTCASLGYRKLVGHKTYRWSYHTYPINVYEKGSSSHGHASGSSIVALAVKTPALSTLVTAVKAAGFAHLFSSPGHYTVFAPTNEAFSEIPASLLKALLDPDNKEKLQQLLKYHVHSGNVYSSQLRNGMKVSTLEGRKLTVELEDGHVEIIGGKHSDEATVTKANIRASNGVVHVIDKVLIPADWHAPEH